jgi:hypothetical protein
VRLNFTSAAPGVITVKNIRVAYDLPPVMLTKDPAGPASVEEGGALAFGVTAADPDNDPLSSRWLLDGLQVETGALAFVYRPDYASSGVHNLTVTVSDGALTVSATWLVTVADVNRPPVIEETSPEDQLPLAVGVTARFDVRASDPDGSPLVYSWSVDGTPAGSNDRSFDYSAPKTPGAHSVAVVISDGRDAVNHTWAVEVYKPAEPPVNRPALPVVQIAAGVLLALAFILAVVLLTRRQRGGAHHVRRRKSASKGRPGGISGKLKNGDANQPQP